MKSLGESSNIISEAIPCKEISDPAVLVRNPLVTVKMITYNHEAYIAQAIEGVVKQETEYPFELIIGEDCSTDGTREIVFDYQKKHPSIIRVITSDHNVGARKNTKRTRPPCRGKYIAFCEGDDYWHHPKKLQMQVDYLEAHPEVGLVYSDVAYYFVTTGKRIPSYFTYNEWAPNHGYNDMIHLGECVDTCTSVVRKDLCDEIYETCQFEFSEQFLMGDTPLWIEIAHRSKVKCINEVLATRNILPYSASHPKGIEKRTAFVKNAMEMLLHYANKYGGDHSMEIKRDIIRHFSRTLMYYACRARKPDLGREVLERVRKCQVPLDLISYLYLIGSHNVFASYLVRIVVLPVRLARRILRIRYVYRLKVSNDSKGK